MHVRHAQMLIALLCLLGQVAAVALPRGSVLCVGCFEGYPAPVSAGYAESPACPCCSSVGEPGEAASPKSCCDSRPGHEAPRPTPTEECRGILIPGADLQRVEPRLDVDDAGAPPVLTLSEFEFDLPGRAHRSARTERLDPARWREQAGLLTARLLI